MITPADVPAWVILPVHNRREVTLRCLANLQRNGDLEKYHILVVDDGSQDGTSETIQAAHPQVEILRGDGSLWWTGAMAWGMQKAMEAGAGAVFWLNDDCHPRPGALDLLIGKAVGKGCITAAYPHTEVGIVYSGLQKTFRGLRPVACQKEEEFEVDACNGNCVCIPRAIIDRIGYPDAAAFPQYHGDTDYVLRSNCAGFRCLMLKSAECNNELPPSLHVESWLMSENPFLTHWRRFYSVKSPYHFRSYALFCWRHWNVWGVVLFCTPYVRLVVMRLVAALLPRKILLRYLGSRSLNWRLQGGSHE